MITCQNCAYKENPEGHCVEGEYKVVRNEKGKVISKQAPIIVCDILRQGLRSCKSKSWR